MRAVQFSEYGSTPALVDLPEPACPPDGAVIRVRATGICRSDWHAWQGHDPVALPHVPGHELAGEIVALGDETTYHRVGERVTTPFVCGCGRCEYCRVGNSQVCPDQTQPGFTGPGSFAEYVAIHAADYNLVTLPEAIDIASAASLGCRFATAYRAVTVHGRVHPGDWVAVHGCGGVGLAAVMVAVALGARVIAVDPSPAARARASELGAEITLASGPDVASRIVAATGGGASVSLDAVGLTETAIASIESLRPRGRHIQVGLMFGEHAAPRLPLGRMIALELEIYGSHGVSPRDYPPLLALVASGALRPDLLIGHLIGLSDAGAALVAMSEPATRTGITVVDLDR